MHAIRIIHNIVTRLCAPVRHWRMAAVLILPVLAACSVDVDQGGPRPGRPQPICTMEYAPVCGQRGRQTETFSNACQAASSGFRVVSRGECRREPVAQACTREYAPVCAERGRQRQTFANACEARSDGFNVVSRGECRRQPDMGRACTREYAPVCARRGRNSQTFANACEAQSQNFRIVHPGQCR